MSLAAWTSSFCLHARFTNVAPPACRFTFSRGDVALSGATRAALADLLRNWRGQQLWPPIVLDCVATGPFGTRRSAKASFVEQNSPTVAPAAQSESLFAKYVYEETSRPATFFGPMIRRAAAALCPDVFPHIVPCTQTAKTMEAVRGSSSPAAVDFARHTSSVVPAVATERSRAINPKGPVPNSAAMNNDSTPNPASHTADDSPRASF